jgi:hypothetical protein
VARQNRSDGSYEEHSKVSIERNPIEDSSVGGESEMSRLVDGEIKLQKMKEFGVIRRP